MSDGIMYNVPRVIRFINKVVAPKYVSLNRYPTLMEMDMEFSRMKLSEKERWLVWMQTCQCMWYQVFHSCPRRTPGLDPWEDANSIQGIHPKVIDRYKVGGEKYLLSKKEIENLK